MKIFKKVVEDDTQGFVDIPECADVLSVSRQFDQAVVHYLHAPGSRGMSITFVMTGQPKPYPEAIFVGTVLLDNEAFVLHFFKPPNA